MERTVALGDEGAEPVGAFSRPLRDIAPHAEIRAVRPNDEHPAVTQARVMDRRAKVHGELAADAVRRGVRKDNGPDAVILLKSDRRHFSHSSVRSGFRHKVYPYLLRGKTIDRANQVWAADITYIPMRQGFLYLVAIIDWATRREIGRA